MIILGIQKNKLSVLPLYSNVYDDATDFKICEFDKNTKMKISREQNNFFFQKKKKIINCTSRANLLQKKICSGGNVWQKITESNKKQNC